MYGTVSRMVVKPGMQEKLEKLSNEYRDLSIIGMQASFVFQMDKNSNEYYVIAVFDSEDAYKANAASEDQDKRYQAMRELLAADPEWHDGTIVQSFVRENAH